MHLRDTLAALVQEHSLLQLQMSDVAVLSNPKELARIGKRLAALAPLPDLLLEYDRLTEALQLPKQSDMDLETLAQAEREDAQEKLPALEAQLKKFLLPPDPDDDRGVILEVRAGAGGEEAALFAAELLRMYIRFAESQGWKTELLDRSDADGGGIKEASCRIEGAMVYGALKYESGVHRIQRIPETEAKGRIHTSTATVAILPEAEEVDISINPNDLKVDTFRSSGAGGQNVNKVETAIRITHLPTGLVVACQTERSQTRNRELAMNILRSRLYAAEQERLSKERGDLRSGQIGTADRSEKIRTYNVPQDRVTDHRINQNFGHVSGIFEGKISPILEALKTADEEEKMKKVMKA